MGNIDANYVLESHRKNITSIADIEVGEFYDHNHQQEQQAHDQGDHGISNDAMDDDCDSPASSSANLTNPSSQDDLHGGSYFYLNNDFLSEEFRDKSAEVACDIVTYVCRSGFLDPLPPPSKTSQIMRHLVDDLLKNREEFMYSMAQKIAGNLQDPENLSTLLNELATQMFDDGIVTWNRVVTFHAFCGFVARFAGLERGMPHAEELVSEVLTGVVVNRLGLWIMAYGGWANFDKQFPAVCIFSLGSLWKLFIFVMILASAVFMFYKFVRQLDGQS